MQNRQTIIQHLANQGGLFRVLRLAFQQMTRRELDHIGRQGLVRAVNAPVLDNLANEMRFLEDRCKLIEK